MPVKFEATSGRSTGPEEPLSVRPRQWSPVYQYENAAPESFQVEAEKCVGVPEFRRVGIRCQ